MTSKYQIAQELAHQYSKSSLIEIKEHAIFANQILRDHKAPLHERQKFQALAIAIDDILDYWDDGIGQDKRITLQGQDYE